MATFQVRSAQGTVARIQTAPTRVFRVTSAARGPRGAIGPQGPGVPVGGTTGQVLAKVSNTDNDTHWTSAGSAAVDSVNGQTGVVVLTQDSIGDGTTYKQYSATEKTKLSGIATAATANSSDATLLARANHTGTQSADTITDGTTNKAYTATEKTKLSGIATGATANSSDATLLARANHTGTQLAATVSDFSTAADARITAATGVSVQGYDADLAAIAALTATTNNFIVSVASAWASRTPAQAKTTLSLDNVDNTSDVTKNAAAVALTNKTISGASNTLSAIANASLTNSTVTIGSTSVALGATAATLAGLTLTAPVLGAATATSINKVTITAPATSAVLTIANGKTLTANNTLTLAGTDSTTMTFPSSTDTLAGLAAIQTITGAWSFNDAKLILNGLTSGTTTLKSGAIAGTSIITLPIATDTLVGKATTDTLTNKTATNLLLTAGTTALAPLVIAAGTNLTAALSGAIEFDGTKLYYTTSTPTRQEVVSLGQTQTLSNKRITVRVNTTASSATPAINSDTTDQFTITALAANITSMTTSLTGTPTDGQKLMIRFKDNGTARTIAWGTSFVSSGVATLLATTAISKTHMVQLIYDSAAAKWVCMAVDATGY